MRAWALVFLVLSGCGSESKLTPEETGSPAGSTADGEARLQGKVWTVEGDPVLGAIVSVGARKAATNALGFFVLEDLPVGEAVISAEAEGYGTTSAVRTLREEAWAYVDLRVSPAEVLSWDPAEGGVLESESGVEIGLGALKDALGEEVRGEVEVSVTLLADAEGMKAAPGALMASQDGQDALLESLGMVEVRLSDESGLPVQLAEPAELSFPVAEVEDQEGFGLFGYDEASGRWQEVGGGEVEDGRFQVEVEHFSWWNCDRFANTDQCVTGTLKAGEEVVAGATVSVYEEESLTRGSFETDEDGRFTIDLPAGAEVQLSLDYGVYAWESELFSLPQVVVDEDERPEGCVDLGEVTARSSDEDEDGFASEGRGGPDCQDDDPEINPGVEERWYDGVDSDCGYDDDYDQDGDGHRSEDYGGGDCADTDLWTHPGRVDYCDGEDDNCSGDESDASDADDWYQDQDGDGYGTDASETRACEAPGVEWVSEGGDCDDTEVGELRFYPGATEDCGEPVDYNCDGSVSTENEDGDDFPACADCDDGDPLSYPGAAEICDDKDNDCNGTTDDDPVDAKTYYLDYDADTFGELTTAYVGCSVPEGYVEDSGGGGDCDDLDPERYPGATEICGDDVVQDCVGTEEEAWEVCSWSGDVDLGDADATLVGDGVGEAAGYSVSSAGDVNGDSHNDLLVGAPAHVEDDVDQGAAYLVLGPVSGDLSLGDANARLIGELSSNYAGWSVSTAGDVDGDGYADLLVSAPWYADATFDTGAAYVVLGPISGELNLGDASARLIGEESNDQAGKSVFTAGDVDGDGQADVLVGAPYYGPEGSSVGAAYLVVGPVSGDLSLGDATARLLDEECGYGAGWSVSTAGDVDGDGLDDLLVGAPYFCGEEINTGAAYVVLGATSGSFDLVEASGRLIGEDDRDEAGWSVSTAGDVDGDGLADVFMGAPGHDEGGIDAGAAYVVTGPVSGDLDLEAATAKILGEESGQGEDWAVSTAGDVDGDGLSDLLVGLPYYDDGEGYIGRAFLFLGPVSGEVSLGEAVAQFFGEESICAGKVVSTAGDMNSDGLADLFVGAPYSDNGAAYLLLSPSY